MRDQVVKDRETFEPIPEKICEAITSSLYASLDLACHKHLYCGTRKSIQKCAIRLLDKGVIADLLIPVVPCAPCTGKT